MKLRSRGVWPKAASDYTRGESDFSSALSLVSGMAKEMAKMLGSASMAVRSCKVTYLDAGGIEHAVQVSAQTLYEAIAQALRVFRDQPWCDSDLRQSAASVLVKIAPLQIEHRVKISDFEAWLASPGKSPAAAIFKSRLRAIVEG